MLKEGVPMPNGIGTPLKPPPGYDLDIARTCSFLVNVASDMCKQWISAGMPAPGKFSWTPADSCSITGPKFPLDQWSLSLIFWSTFSPSASKTVTEPFGVVAFGPYQGTGFLAFRGSQTNYDFAMDGKIKMVPYTPPASSPISGMQVAQGFYEVFNGLTDAAFSDVLSQTAGLDRVIVTGHSLGSALATLFIPVQRVSAPGQTILHYNQASPKVGNSSFQAYYDSLGAQTFRLVNTYDEVPKLPPGAYVPVGVEAPFGADYPTEAERHNPCCSYSYALFNPNAPYNPEIGPCMA
jgi:hypothetical protein